MSSIEHSENLHLIARESRELKETIHALRGEFERIRHDAEVRFQSALDATNGEILQLRATIRRLRENLDAAPTGEHERADTFAFEASANILSLETTVDQYLLADEHAFGPAAAAASGELDELRETIVQLRNRLDRANVAWDEKMKAIESVGLSRRRKLEETIKILRERLQRASANCGRK